MVVMAVVVGDEEGEEAGNRWMTNGWARNGKIWGLLSGGTSSAADFKVENVWTCQDNIYGGHTFLEFWCSPSSSFDFHSHPYYLYYYYIINDYIIRWAGILIYPPHSSFQELLLFYDFIFLFCNLQKFERTNSLMIGHTWSTNKSILIFIKHKKKFYLWILLKHSLKSDTLTLVVHFQKKKKILYIYINRSYW